MKSKLKLHDSLKLIKNFKTTGTITPSSKKLVERLLAPIDFSETGLKKYQENAFINAYVLIMNKTYKSEL